VRDSQRFVQLGVGWVLRELSLADHDLVVNFIKSNYAYFSREGLRYAIEKMSGAQRTKLLSHKEGDKSDEEEEHEEEKNTRKAKKIAAKKIEVAAVKKNNKRPAVVDKEEGVNKKQKVEKTQKIEKQKLGKTQKMEKTQKIEKQKVGKKQKGEKTHVVRRSARLNKM